MTFDQTRTWKLITMFFIALALGAFTYYGAEIRQPLVDRLTGKKINIEAASVPDPSPASKTQLNQFIDSKDWLLGINVMRVDFQENTRTTTYRYFKDPVVENAWRAFDATKQPVALFGSEEASNQRLVNLINGQFSCVRTLDTLVSRLIPMINQHSIATCQVPIPPGYGDFAGFINVFLRRQPTGAEILQLQDETHQISLDIYQRDTVKSTRAFGEMLKK